MKTMEIRLDDLHIRIQPALRLALEEKAAQEGLSLNQWVAKTLGHVIGRPDLGIVPRNKTGRPRKEREPQPAAS